MKYRKDFTLSTLILLFLGALGGYAQTLPDCDIPVKANIVNASKSFNNGEINLDFGPEVSLKDIKILVAEPFEKVVWREVERNKVAGLKAGFYDIVIIDKSRKGCIKQMTVEIKSN